MHIESTGVIFVQYIRFGREGEIKIVSSIPVTELEEGHGATIQKRLHKSVGKKWVKFRCTCNL